MNFDKFYDKFKIKCKETGPFINGGIGRILFFIFIGIMILIFFAPLFQTTVGTALIGCVAAPFLVLLWRKNDYGHSIVPAVFISLAMLLSLIIYLIAGKPSVAAYYLSAMVCLVFISETSILNFFDKIEDDLKMYLTAAAICVAIVIVSSFLAFLVSVSWWILCLIAFLALVVFFFSVVLGTAAYTATDDKRQAKKKKKKQIQAQQKMLKNNGTVISAKGETYNAEYQDEYRN